MHSQLLKTALVAAATVALATSLGACEGKEKTEGTTSSEASAARTETSASASAVPSATAQSPFSKIAEVDTAKKDAAEKFAKDYLEKHKAGKYEKLGDAVIPLMQTQLTPEVQQKAHEQIKAAFGEFKSLDFVEAWKGPGDTVVYRFRGTYEKGKPEVRVVFDKDGKVAGFFVLQWADDIQPQK